MTDENTTTPAGIGPQDILFVLFRRKWLIVGFSVLGLLGAAALFFTTKPTYQSEAKLLLRYVQESRTATTMDKDSQIRTPDMAGDGIVNSEREILNSFDLATQVAEIIGPERILGSAGKETNLIKAAIMVQRNLQVDVLPRSSIIRLFFSHTDPDVAQAVLKQVIASYLKKHVELHLGIGDLEKFLAQQTDQLKSRLNQTDEALQKVKAKAGVISPEETRKVYVDEMSKIRQELVQLEAQIAEHRAMLGDAEKDGTARSEDAVALGIPVEKLDEYKSLCDELTRAQSTRRDMLNKYTPENPALQRFLERLTRTEQDKKKLEQEFPKLATLGVTPVSVGTNRLDFASENTLIKALESKAKVLTKALAVIKAEAAGIEQAESEINELMRQRAVEEAHFLSYSKSLEQARIQENLGAGKITNIGEVQAASFPTRSRAEIKKWMLKVGGGGVAAGLALAFALEFLLDQSIKRPQEIETRLRLPLFFSLPSLRNKRKRLLPSGKREHEAELEEGSETALWNGNGSLRPYFEAMRDRLIQYFESRNLTHKPKLVAVTGCGAGVGVSSIARGLALSLSEAGDGNILLVDMSSDQGAAHSFMRSEPAVSLPDVLEAETRGSAQVNDKLYLATANQVQDGLPQGLPRRFMRLMPKMKASDYDFIIFDLPPVGPTSMTPRLSGFMDLVLQVVEAGKTNRDFAKRAAAVIGEVQPNVSIVVNKCQTHLPACLQQQEL